MSYSRIQTEHLKLVQGVVSRLAGNSSNLKMWTVILVGAVFVTSGLSENPHWLIAAGGWISIAAFWAMDARYLHFERCYIKLYNAIVSGRSVAPYDLDYRPYAKETDSPWRVAWSWSVFGFYGPLLTVMLTLLGILASSDF